MVEIMAGSVCLLLSFWEIHTVHSAFSKTKQSGGESTSNFLLAALWSGILFGIIMFFGGLTLIFHGY